MAVVPAVPALSSYDVPSAQATAYTVPTEVVRFRIDQASVVNYSGSSVNLTLYLLQNGDSVANLTQSLVALPIPAGEAIPLFELVGRSLDTGGIVNAFGSSANALSLSITGTEFK